MKICNECNIAMIDNCDIDIQHTFELGASGSSDISIRIPTNEQSEFLGIKFNIPNTKRLKSRVCPRCGKVEFYVDFTER